MSEKYKLIYDLLSKKIIDWNAVELAVKSLGNTINDKYEEGTILSELYMPFPWYNYSRFLHKEIDHEETDTDIIIRADVYRMHRDKQ